jgi:transcriptional/translational regulatory protein YebC/TACO1
MVITKIKEVIIIAMNNEELNAVDYFIKQRGIAILDEYFGHFFQTRIDTAALEQKTDVMRVFNSLTLEEQEEFLSRGTAE